MTSSTKQHKPHHVARVRLVQSLVSLLAVTAPAFLARSYLATPWWWISVGAGTLISAALLEPNFTDPRSSVANAIAALAAWTTATHSSVAVLWQTYGAFAALLLVLALVSLAVPAGVLRTVSKWIATRLSRGRILGYSALGIEVVRVAGISAHAAVELFIGLSLAVIFSSLDWNKLIGILPSSEAAGASVEVATEPNLLLISSATPLRTGMRIHVVGELGASDGTVLTPLAHRSGSRYQAVLDDPWWKVVPRAGSDCVVTVLDDVNDYLGFAAEGSTEKVIEVHPVRPLTYGEPLTLEKDDGTPILYQISALKLERYAWDNASVIEPRARAVQVGLSDSESMIAFTPYLPKPYQPLRDAMSFKVSLGSKFQRIGIITGTGIEIGVDAEAARGSHLAILGMSGMGKTTVARRICSILSNASAVVALDGTGEYASRLGFDPLPSGSKMENPGEWVKEQPGDPPMKCRDFIKEVMGYASTEYLSGSGGPKNRTLLLEEAHSFLPEWNFATRPQTDAVSESCRFILQARKFGISFVFVSQRTAVISKSALSQCESYVIFRTLDQTSQEYIESVVGPDLREAVASLGRHQAICVGPAFNCSSPVIVSLDPPSSE